MRNNRKDFKRWIVIKEKLDYVGELRTINDGEVWWCAVGENVGSEICGKGETFARPVLVLRKLSKYNFVGIPLTSKKHEGSWYVCFKFKKRLQTAVVSQVENISVYRLYSKIGRVPNSDLELVKEGLMRLIAKNIP